MFGLEAVVITKIIFLVGGFGSFATVGHICEKKAQKRNQAVQALARRTVQAEEELKRSQNALAASQTNQATVVAYVPLSDTAFQNPSEFMQQIALDPAHNVALRARVKPMILTMLGTENPSVHDLNRCLRYAIRLSLNDEFLGYIKKLVIKGAEVDTLDGDSERPLSLAIYWCLPKTVALLLALKADYSLKTHGILPLNQARRHGNDLVRTSADNINTLDLNSVAILAHCIEANKIICKILQDAGTNVVSNNPDPADD